MEKQISSIKINFKDNLDELLKSVREIFEQKTGLPKNYLWGVSMQGLGRKEPVKINARKQYL